jgi:DnaJ-class molecular chaperone
MPNTRWPGTVRKPVVATVECSACNGEGSLRDDEKKETSTCMKCKGRGFVKRERWDE